MKLLLLYFFLHTLSSHAQWYRIDHQENYRFISVGLDPAQALYGSSKNEPGFNGVIRVGANHSKVRVSVFYERFELIKYQSYGSTASYVMDPFKNIKAIAGGEVSMINRMGPTFMSYALHGELEYHFPRWFLFAKADLKRRTDISQKWGYSNYVGLGYKF